IERYMASDDPDFETKAADIIGLYMNPPRHAAVVFVWMKRRQFKLWIVWTPSFLFLQVEPNGTDSSTTVMEPSRSTRRSIRQQVKFSARQRHGIPAKNLWRFLLISLIISASIERSTSLPTTSRLTRRSAFATFCTRIPTFTSTTRPPTRHGSTRSKTGFRRSSEMSLPAESLHL